MRIYRVEHKTKKKGPYTADGRLVIPDSWCAGIGDKHPSPHYDGPNPLMENNGFGVWFCGFTSMESLYEWFYTAAVVEKLIVENFTIRVFEVDDAVVRVGVRQCTFQRQGMPHIDEIPLDIMKCSDHITNPYLK